jgi:hypothetical protein
MLLPDRAVGWESGRRSPFSADQYLPFVAHVERAGGVTSLGALATLGTTGIDCRSLSPDAFHLTLRSGQGPVGLCLRSNEPFEADGDEYRVGPYRVALAPYARERSSERTTAGFELRASWVLADTTVRVTIDR